ncbi:ras-related protein Rab-14-like isoform X2 [Argiope bruennichi]|uniref:ras-related protein Rab-14-like isoform X2 n=1 Tax=Argiope bruennichi TaxID=94029 RepID=UPI0024954BE0|nr:ras-related protein Rab-14-like isoform X2 [Argiope bruennichi]
MALNRPMKIVTLGDSNDIPITIVDILQTQMNIENKKVDLFLWDTGGQERFKSLISNYFRLADGALLVYDVTRISTFAELPGWLSLLRAVNDKASVVIVGNKIDEADLKNVTLTAVKDFAAWHRLDFVEASAKTGENVEEIFQLLTKKILKSISLTSSDEADNSEDTEMEKSDFQQDDTELKLLPSNSMHEVPSRKKRCC